MEFDDPVYEHLSRKYGKSAATTYLCLRKRQVPALAAWGRLKLQVEKMGINHPGGSSFVVECRRLPCP